MSKKAIYYIGFFAVLILVFFLVVKKWLVANNTISVVQPFSFVNQDGKPVTDKDFEGKVYVAEYFFTNCTGICPRMNANLKQVYERFKDEKDFRILSHTCDPERDSVPQLRKYANTLGVNTSTWIFVTGRKDSLYKAARTSYTLDDPANNLKSIDDVFLHTEFWALVNKKGQVKRIYDGLLQSEVEKMMHDIEGMLKE